MTHGAGLAAIWGTWARFVKDKHLNRFVQFAVNVMGVIQDFANPHMTALRGIEAMECFFKELNMPTNIPDLIGRQMTEDEIDELVDKCSRGGKMNIGAMEVLAPEDMKAIYQLANG